MAVIDKESTANLILKIIMGDGDRYIEDVRFLMRKCVNLNISENKNRIFNGVLNYVASCLYLALVILYCLYIILTPGTFGLWFEWPCVIETSAYPDRREVCVCKNKSTNHVFSTKSTIISVTVISMTTKNNENNR